MTIVRVGYHTILSKYFFFALSECFFQFYQTCVEQCFQYQCTDSKVYKAISIEKICCYHFDKGSDYKHILIYF